MPGALHTEPRRPRLRGQPGGHVPAAGTHPPAAQAYVTRARDLGGAARDEPQLPEGGLGAAGRAWPWRPGDRRGMGRPLCLACGGGSGGLSALGAPAGGKCPASGCTGRREPCAPAVAQPLVLAPSRRSGRLPRGRGGGEAPGGEEMPQSPEESRSSHASRDLAPLERRGGRGARGGSALTCWAPVGQEVGKREEDAE